MVAEPGHRVVSDVDTSGEAIDVLVHLVLLVVRLGQRTVESVVRLRSSVAERQVRRRRVVRRPSRAAIPGFSGQIGSSREVREIAFDLNTIGGIESEVCSTTIVLEQIRRRHSAVLFKTAAYAITESLRSSSDSHVVRLHVPGLEDWVAGISLSLRDVKSDDLACYRVRTVVRPEAAVLVGECVGPAPYG